MFRVQNPVKLTDNTLVDEVLVLPPPTIAECYHVRRKEDVRALKTKFKFHYQTSPYIDKIEAPIYIAPVAALNGGYGAYAADDLNNLDDTNKFLTEYKGRTKTFIPNDKSEYLFVRYDDVIIDAATKGNWSRFMNHSTDGNVFSCQDETDGKPYVIMQSANKAIRKDDQLLYDYGHEYIKKMSKEFSPIYLHTSDNWRHPHDCYLEKKEEFHDRITMVDQAILNILGIGHSNAVLATKIFLAIHNNNIKQFEKYLSTYNVETVSYVIEKIPSHTPYQISPIAKQENITPLMLACVMGRKQMIIDLVNANADINRCGLHNGKNALFLLLEGNADEETKLEIMKLFIAKKINLNVTDSKENNILHYALKMNLEKIVKLILSQPAGEDLRNNLCYAEKNKLAIIMSNKRKNIEESEQPNKKRKKTVELPNDENTPEHRTKADVTMEEEIKTTKESHQAPCSFFSGSSSTKVVKKDSRRTKRINRYS